MGFKIAFTICLLCLFKKGVLADLFWQSWEVFKDLYEAFIKFASKLAAKFIVSKLDSSCQNNVAAIIHYESGVSECFFSEFYELNTC